jgi:succinate dehydrogenase/fumarate reductase flavoprotein subunit
MTEIQRLSYDVVVIGAGGSGLRAAIGARLAGKKTAIISKSLFGKAHTVMAEGGAAAAMGNVNSRDNWQVHFRDTMRGGKFMNSWRMAELHAKEAPERSGSWSNGARCSTAPGRARSANETSAATATPAWRTSATGRAWR